MTWKKGWALSQGSLLMAQSYLRQEGWGQVVKNYRLYRWVLLMNDWLGNKVQVKLSVGKCKGLPRWGEGGQLCQEVWADGCQVSGVGAAAQREKLSTHPLWGKDKLVPFHRSCFKPPSRAWLNGANLGAHAHLLQGPSVPFWQWWSKAVWHFPKCVMAAWCKSESSSSCVFNHSNKI